MRETDHVQAGQCENEIGSKDDVPIYWSEARMRKLWESLYDEDAVSQCRELDMELQSMSILQANACVLFKKVELGYDKVRRAGTDKTNAITRKYVRIRSELAKLKEQCEKLELKLSFSDENFKKNEKPINSVKLTNCNQMSVHCVDLTIDTSVVTEENLVNHSFTPEVVEDLKSSPCLKSNSNVKKTRIVPSTVLIKEEKSSAPSIKVSDSNPIVEKLSQSKTSRKRKLKGKLSMEKVPKVQDLLDSDEDVKLLNIISSHPPYSCPRCPKEGASKNPSCCNNAKFLGNLCENCRILYGDVPISMLDTDQILRTCERHRPKYQINPTAAESLLASRLPFKELSIGSCKLFPWLISDDLELFCCVPDPEFVQAVTETMAAEIQEFCESTTESHYPVVQELCLAKYDADGTWYRAVCIKISSAHTAQVELVDFGNTLTVENSKIRKMPEKFLTLPRMVVKCTIEGLEVPTDEDRKRLIMNSMETNKPYDVKVIRLISKGSYLVSFPEILETLRSKSLV